MAASPSWIRSPAKSGMRSPSADVFQISLRTWLSADEVTALTTSVRCRPRSEVPDDEPAVVDPPYQTMTAYALNVRTGKAKKLATYKAQNFFNIVLPGPPERSDLRSHAAASISP